MKLNLTLSILLLILFSSCNDDDVCDEVRTPEITLIFKDFDTKKAIVDTIIVREYNSDTAFVYIDSLVSLPLGGVLDKKSQFILAKSLEKDAPIDTLTVDYLIKQNYISKACGFGLSYEEVNYSSTANLIQEIEANDKEVNNEKKSYIYLYINQ